MNAAPPSVTVTAGAGTTYRFVGRDEPEDFVAREIRRELEWTLLATIEVLGPPPSTVLVRVPQPPALEVALIVSDFDTRAVTVFVKSGGQLSFTVPLEGDRMLVHVIQFAPGFDLAGYVDSLRPRAATPPPDFGEPDFAEPPTAGRTPQKAARPPSSATGRERVPARPVLEFAQVSASMPSIVGLQVPVTVKVTLTRGEIRVGTGEAHDERIIPVDPTKPVDLKILRNQFELVGNASDTRRLKLPADARGVAQLRFLVRATELGMGEIQVVVRQGSAVPLATLLLTAEVRERAPRRPPADAPIPVGVASGTRQFTTPNSLVIDENLAGRRSDLTFSAYFENERPQHFSHSLDNKYVILDTLFDKIAAAWTRQKSTTYEVRSAAFMRELKKLGRAAASRLLPDDLIAALHDRIGSVGELAIVTSGETDIPWEVLYVGDPASDDESYFLGRAGLVRWIYNTAHPEKLRMRRGRTWFLCPEYDDARLGLDTAAEAQVLSELYDATAVAPPDASGLTEVLALEFDFLHFGGHGITDETGAAPTQSIVFGDYRKTGRSPANATFSVSQLKELLAGRRPDPRSGPLVVLNACRVGRPPSGRADIGGFATAFLRGGAAAFIGCLWSIDDDQARNFVVSFYNALDRGETVGAATLAARIAAQEGDATWLAYTVYAHPDAVLVH